MTNFIETALDFEDFYKSLSHKVDILLTDPPYPFENKNGSQRFQFKNSKDKMYDRISWTQMDKFAELSWDNMADQGRAFVFCNKDTLMKTQSIFESKGFTFRNYLILDKEKMGMGYHFRNQVEYILYCSKGKPARYATGCPNIFHFKKPNAKNANSALKWNPTNQSAKPFQVFESILVNIAVDGDVAADPFAGSNPLRAALLNNIPLQKKISNCYTNTL